MKRCLARPREQHVSSDVEVDGERVFWNMARQPDGDKDRHAKVLRPMPEYAPHPTGDQSRQFVASEFDPDEVDKEHDVLKLAERAAASPPAAAPTGLCNPARARPGPALLSHAEIRARRSSMRSFWMMSYHQYEASPLANEPNGNALSQVKNSVCPAPAGTTPRSGACSQTESEHSAMMSTKFDKRAAALGMVACVAALSDAVGKFVTRCLAAGSASERLAGSGVTRCALFLLVVSLTVGGARAAPDARSAATCTELGWAAARRLALVCAASDAPLAGCAEFASWATARARARRPARGSARSDELSADEARGTGCGFDDEDAWSSTSCGEDAYFVQRGATTGGDDAECVASGALHAVRCCADEGGGGSRVRPSRTTARSIRAATAAMFTFLLPEPLRRIRHHDDFRPRTTCP